LRPVSPCWAPRVDGFGTQSESRASGVIGERSPKRVSSSSGLSGGEHFPDAAYRVAATHACTAPVYRDRYQKTKARIGKQRGAKVAQIDLARRLSEAIWHMLSRGEPFAPKGATDPLAA